MSTKVINRSLFPVGDGKRPLRATFDLLAEPDMSFAEFMASDPLMVEMRRGYRCWGDLCCAPDLTPLPVVQLWRQPESEESIWSQPWAGQLEQPFGDVYDTAALSDTDYAAFMTWLYAVGWSVESADRTTVKAVPDTLPPRVWVERPVVAAAPRKMVTVQRFCRAGAECKEDGCRYVHGDTIHRLNEPCAFGADCGASDPTGVKRSQCLRMHPGETWTPSLVIRRPCSC